MGSAESKHRHGQQRRSMRYRANPLANRIFTWFQRGLIHIVDRPVGNFMSEDEQRGIERDDRAVGEGAQHARRAGSSRTTSRCGCGRFNCKAVDGQRITLSAPSKWIKEWFQDNYQSDRARCASRRRPTGLRDRVRGPRARARAIRRRCRDRESVPVEVGPGREVGAAGAPICSTSTTSSPTWSALPISWLTRLRARSPRCRRENTIRCSSMAASVSARPTWSMPSVIASARSTPAGAFCISRPRRS